MHNSSFCRMAFTLCICLLFSGCAASLSDANAKGKETVTESTSQTDSVDLTQPSDGSSDAAQMKIISSANGNRREDQERQYVRSGFLQIPVDISHILGNLITVIFDYQILRKPLKILSL